MKKTILMMALVLAASVIFTGTARADLPTFDKFYMVSQADALALNTSAAEKTSYDLSETPYLYVHLSSAMDVNLMTFWGNFDDGHNTATFTPSTGSGQDFFLTPTDWTTQKSLGNWDVFGSYKTQQNIPCDTCGTTSFVVTPEPMSMVLYGMGGLPLAAHFLRRRKQIAA
ncbi:MAG: hypothetical protein HGA80_08425 [Candidatus Omnitrophica bacterium]|nr:hypothetical protein [Candidatus Omnitrophota bacterium]